MALKQNPNSNTAADGSQYVTLTDGAGNLIAGNTTAVTVGQSSDALANTFVGSLSLSEGMVYNGTTWDRSRSILAAGTTSGSTGLQAVCLAPSTNSNAGLANTATSAAAGSLVLKASAGNLYSLCANAGASAGYLMVFDAAAAPADGAVTPVYSMPIAANGAFFTDFAYPIRCTTGITLVFSTTGPFTKTISATAFLSGQFL